MIILMQLLLKMFWEKPSGYRYQTGKRTLLVIEALNRANSKQRRRLLEILDSDNNDEDIVEAVNIMDECGALSEMPYTSK